MGAFAIIDLSRGGAQVGTVDVTALLILDPEMEPRQQAEGATKSARGDSLSACMGAAPLGLVSVLGRPLICRLVESLSLTGIRKFEIFSTLEQGPAEANARRCVEALRSVQIGWRHTTPEDLWETVESRYEGLFAAGAQALLVAGAWSYFELGSANAVASLCAHPCTRVQDAAGDLDAFWSVPGGREEMVRVLRSKLMATRDVKRLRAATYANRLRSGGELLQLTRQAFNLKLAFRPAGREWRPGVWLGEGARIHHSARVIAPAHIGDFTKIRAAVLVTRGSSIEHHCEVDCGTVVQGSNILPNSYLGVGLEIMHSVVGARHIANATKQRTVEIFDAKLVNENSTGMARKLFGSAGRLASYLPMQVVNGIRRSLSKSECERKPDVAGTALATTIPQAAETVLAAGAVARSRVRDLRARDHGNE